MPGGVHENMRAWDPEEDNIILEMRDLLGPKWSKIVQRLPGRSISSVRNRWQRIEKGRLLRESGTGTKNRCQQCGQPKKGHVCLARLKNRGESGEVMNAASVEWEQAQRGPDSAYSPPYSPMSPAEMRRRELQAAKDKFDAAARRRGSELYTVYTVTDEPDAAPAADAALSRMHGGARAPAPADLLAGGFEALLAAANQQSQAEGGEKGGKEEEMTQRTEAAPDQAAEVKRESGVVEEPARTPATEFHAGAATSVPPPFSSRLPSALVATYGVSISVGGPRPPAVDEGGAPPPATQLAQSAPPVPQATLPPLMRGSSFASSEPSSLATASTTECSALCDEELGEDSDDAAE